MSYGESFSIASYLNVHAGTWHYVDLWGHTVNKVRGRAPFWLELPRSHRLLLISDADSSAVTIVVADIATREIHRIDGRGTSLGHDFGGSSPDATWAEWLEADLGSIIVARKNAGDVKVRMTINLDTGTSTSSLVD